jgi:hypothetical protein
MCTEKECVNQKGISANEFFITKKDRENFRNEFKN